MIVSSEALIPALAIHRVGNKSALERVQFSDEVLHIDEETLMDGLMNYFVQPWKTPEFHQFVFSDGNVEMNAVYQYVKTIFETPSELYNESKKIASYLYENSAHPNIKAGDLFVAYIEDLLIEDELVNAIAIFKAENRDSFLKMDWRDTSPFLSRNLGIALNKVDKACLIFNTDAANGYKVLSMDKVSSSQEAHFWQDGFLGLSPKTNAFFQTKQFIQLTKQFVDDRLAPLSEVDKIDETAIMFRSKEFFNKSENFNQEEYQETLFPDEETLEQFKDYVNEYQEENGVDLESNFTVSIPAVKNQNKVFKSVIKLDKNFHVYVHGDRRLIEKGVDEEGRKFYRIFYETES